MPAAEFLAGFGVVGALFPIDLLDSTATIGSSGGHGGRKRRKERDWRKGVGSEGTRSFLFLPTQGSIFFSGKESNARI